MGRRIEVELTSTRDDGSWTWRAAGARQPRGDLGGALLYEGAKVGDVVKVEAEFHVDGIEVVEVFAPKQKKERTNLLEMKTRQFRDDELVSTQRVARNDRRGGRGGSRNRDDRRGGRRPRNEGSRDRAPQREVEARPKPKRLRPKRVHRDALLAEVADEHRPIVEQVMKDGMPGVRAAIEKQNAEATEAGKPAVDAAPILAIAEKNLSKARLAEWRDRADAALATVDDLDLRDLRSVVVAGNDVARDQESRESAEKLKKALDERVESDHATWLADLESAIGGGRVVRALRLSSRPVKAGAPLPPELATTLASQASEALGPDVGQERWATVLDALAFSPVRSAVTPIGAPSEPNSDLLDAVKRLADRLPNIAKLFGIDPASVPRSAKRRRPARKDGGKQRTRSAGKPKAKPEADTPAASAASSTSESVTPESTASESATPKSAAPEDTTPENITPESAEPESVTPESATPEDTKPENVTPEDTTPESAEPESAEPESVTPGSVTPEDTTPENVTPENVTPEDTKPENVTPENVTPEDTTPEDTTPEDTTPEDTTPESVTPESATPESSPSDESETTLTP